MNSLVAGMWHSPQQTNLRKIVCSLQVVGQIGNQTQKHLPHRGVYEPAIRDVALQRRGLAARG